MGRDVKVTVVGNMSVGKTSLLLCYTTNSFPGEHVPTVFDNYTTNVIVDDEAITLGLWDTAGSTEFDSLRPISYPGTDAFMVCYSITDPNSLQCVEERWVPEITQCCPGTPIILIGTKLDLRSKQDSGLVDIKDAEKVAKQIDATVHIECSALTQEKLSDVFQQTIRVVLSKDDKTKTKAVKTPSKSEKKRSQKDKKTFISFGKTGSKKKKEKK